MLPLPQVMVRKILTCLLSREGGKPDSVLSHNLSRSDASTPIKSEFVTSPSGKDDAFVLCCSSIQVVTQRSEVAAGRIARFTPTRLCCSQVLLMQDPFDRPYVGKIYQH